MTAKHLDEVAALENSAGDAGWSRAQFEKELTIPMSRFFVLLSGRNILGYGGFWKVSEEAQITNLVVQPQERRKGWGQKILEAIIRQAISENCTRLNLDVRSRNGAAQALYRKMGFVQKGRRAGFYRDPHDDAVLMEKVL